MARTPKDRIDRASRMRRTAERAPGLRAVGRPVGDDDEAGLFDLHYVREGRRGDAPPVLVIPGGPGLASVLPYRRFRKDAVARGLDVVMVEHRGVGLSRRDRRGNDLPRRVMSVDAVVADLAAVLDAEGIEQVVVVGSSYGTYVAQAFAVTHPDRVAAVVLDSPMLTARDEATVREHARAVLLEGTAGGPETRAVAATLRGCLEEGVPARAGLDDRRFCSHARIVYEFGGAGLLARFLAQVRDGRARQTLRFLAAILSRELDTGAPYVMEFDLVGEIAYRELGFGQRGDGGPFDETDAFADLADRYSPFAGEPFDLPAELPGVQAPVVVLVGDRDLRTPLPVAERIVALAPRGALVTLADHGHSALDTRSTALIEALAGVRDGRSVELPAHSQRLSRLPRAGGTSRHLGRILAGSLALDRVLPRRRARPRT